MTNRSYPPGVPCWLDLTQADPDRTMAFYGDLFGWTYEVRTPSEAPMRYAYALLDGDVVAGVGGPPQPADPEGWLTYVRVDSADDAARAFERHGGSVVSAPTDIPRSGRVALCRDAQGAPIGVWQPGGNEGVQSVNVPGTWNFSELHTSDPDASAAFYASVFGWECNRFDLGPEREAWLLRLPGYGDFLAADLEPEIRERQAEAEVPDGFADAVAWIEPATGGHGSPAHWSVTFAVADADAAHARALELGAEVVTALADTDYTRASTIRDPQGAVLTLSEYRPPSG